MTINSLHTKGNILVPSLAALFACALPLRAAPNVPAPKTLLGAMARADATASYSAIEHVTSAEGTDETRRLYRSGRKRRVEWLSPSVRRGDLLVDDGVSVWLYHRAENSATQTRSVAPHQNSRLTSLGTGYTARIDGAAIVDGRKTWKLTIAAGSRQRRAWIDQATFVTLRRQTLEQGGKLRQGSELRQVHFGPMAASLFSWRPPAGARITLSEGRLYSSLAGASRNCTWLQPPRSLPDGYAFESAIVDTKNGESWLRYSNGLHRFSIFQQKVGDNAVKSGRAIEGGGYYWQRGGSRFLVVGLSPAEASSLASQIR